MKTTVKIFAAVLFAAGATFAISSALAQVSTDPTPSFEVAQTSGPQIGICADLDCKNMEDCIGMGSGQCNSTWNSAVTVNPAVVEQNESIQVTLFASDVSGVETVIANMKNASDNNVGSVQLYDDGSHGDGTNNDGMYGGTWNVGDNVDGTYHLSIYMQDLLKNESTQDQGTFSIGDPPCTQDTDCDTGQVCCVGSGLCGINTCSVDTDCNDNNSGTTDACMTSACPSYCSNTAITTCDDGSDDFCPSTCTNPPDTDCFDTSPPDVSFVDPPTNEYEITTDTYEVLVEAIDNESDIASVTFLLDGTVMDQQLEVGGDGYYHWIWDLAGIPNSPPSYILEARATNGVGIDGLASRTVVVNRQVSNQAPTATITSPANGATVSGMINVTVDATDDTAVTEVRLFHASAGLLGTASASTPSVTVTFGWNADNTATAYVESGISSYAFEPQKGTFPFIPIAYAAEEFGCTTTTTTTNYNQEIYARAYDAESLWGESAHVTVITPITTTTTTCTGTTSGSGTSG